MRARLAWSEGGGASCGSLRFDEGGSAVGSAARVGGRRGAATAACRICGAVSEGRGGRDAAYLQVVL